MIVGIIGIIIMLVFLTMFLWRFDGKATKIDVLIYFLMWSGCGLSLLDLYDGGVLP